MSEGMVERIKNRTVARTVPERETSLVELTTKQPAESTPKLDPAPPLILEADGLVETAQRRQIRLEVSLDEEIDSFCKQQKITIETYLEALHLACKGNEAMVNSVVTQAKERLAERKKAGKIRRIQTQIKQGVPL
jgi:hypothetical protein